jgi:hypothetical protein
MNSDEMPRHPDLLPHVTRRDSARQLVWGMLIDLPSATPVRKFPGRRPGPAIYLAADVQKGTGTGGD